MNSLTRLFSEAIGHANVYELEAPRFLDLPADLRNRIVAAFVREECNEWAEVMDTLPDSYLRWLFQEIALLSDDLPTDDILQTIQNAQVVYYADQIQGQLDDYFDDYLESNGIIGIDERCVEARG